MSINQKPKMAVDSHQMIKPFSECRYKTRFQCFIL
ncbi:hypothetical protein DJ62_3362 [Yersinia enterocolitica]|nr:hypothetical protein DJ62_3362 [Yersinia enterocolitica]